MQTQKSIVIYVYIAMNLSRTKHSTITKIMRNNNGVECLVRLLIVETETGIDVRVLSAIPVSNSTETTYKLAGFTEKTAPSELVSYNENPFAVLVNNLDFLVSQPTRAPSFA